MKKVFVLICLSFLANTLMAQTLHLYGGEDRDVYLGCLNCDDYNSKSIWYEYGTYGSEYNSNSIWNEYGTYGSEYSSYSPWNEHASYPPAILDTSGNFYGYLTLNHFKSNRAEFKLAMILYEHYEAIRDDVSGWYDKIFE